MCLKPCNKKKNPLRTVHVNTLWGGWPDPLLLCLLSLLVCHGPRLHLCAAKYAIEESPEETDACCQPEHFSPTIQGVLPREEAENVMRKLWSHKWHITHSCKHCTAFIKTWKWAFFFLNMIRSHFVTGSTSLFLSPFNSNTYVLCEVSSDNWCQDSRNCSKRVGDSKKKSSVPWGQRQS